MLQTDGTSIIPVNKVMARTQSRTQTIRITAGCSAVWVLSYYLLTNTVFGRISPGGLIMEASNQYPPWLFLSASAGICVLALFALAPKSTLSQTAFPLPIWLLTLFFWSPILAACLLSPLNNPDKRDLESVLIAVAVGAFGARAAVLSRCVFGVFAMIGVIEAMFAVVYYHDRTHTLLSGELHRAGGTFNNPNALYTLMLIAIPFSIMGAIRAKTSITKVFFLAASAAEFSALLLTMSRGGILGTSVAVITLCYLTSRSKKLTAVTIVGSIALVLFVQIGRVKGSINLASTSRSTASHFGLIKDGLRAFVDHPLTGVGVNTFHVSSTTKTARAEFQNVTDEPKNLLVDWLAERGIFGFVLFSLFGMTIFSLVQRSLSNPVTIATGAAWIGLLIGGLVDTPFGPPDRFVGNCGFGLLLGVTACLPVPAYWGSDG